MNKPHKHAELIKLWADGAEIQYKYIEGYDQWDDDEDPDWNDERFEFRIKPEPKPDVVWYMTRRKGSGYNWYEYNHEQPKSKTHWQLKMIEDGETGELKSAEVLK